jgi:hypothetical protein
MEIKRKFEKLVVTKRRFVVRQTASVAQTACAECGAPALAIEQAAKFFGITQRRVFQIIETGAAHYAETETGAVMICLTSLAEDLDGEQTIIPADESR